MPPRKKAANPVSDTAPIMSTRRDFRSKVPPAQPVLPSRPLMVATPTATAVESQTVILTMMVCAIALVGAFGASMMAGILSVKDWGNNFAAAPTCYEIGSMSPLTPSKETGNDSASMADVSISNFSKLGITNWNQVKFFNLYASSTLRCYRATTPVFNWINADSCSVPIGNRPINKVASCTYSSTTPCQVMENFAYTTSSSITASTIFSGSGYALVDCPYGCISGSCIPVCSDSDSSLGMVSKNYLYVKGQTSGLFNGNIATITDSCASPTSLNEGICVNARYSSVASTTVIDCPNGCIDGACVPPTSTPKLYPEAPTSSVMKVNNPPKCTDSDGGIDFYTFGSVIINSVNSSGKIPDGCFTQKPGNSFLQNTNGLCAAEGGNNCYVTEVYCDGGTSGFAYATANCPKGCANGACLK